MKRRAGTEPLKLGNFEPLFTLMSYGWAIALVIIVTAALFALGIFDVSNFIGTKASGFSGVGVSGWNMDSNGILSLKIANQIGQRINITGIGVTVGRNQAAITSANGTPIDNGQKSDALSTTSGALDPLVLGAGYTATVVINYTDMNSGYSATTKGTLTGKVVSPANIGESCATLSCSGGYTCDASLVCKQSINLAAISGVPK